MAKLLALLFGVSLKTVYNNKDRYIYLLINKYFSENEILEFLEKKEIKKLELIKNLSVEELEELLPKIDKSDEIDFLKKMDELKKFEQRLLYTFIKYYTIDLTINWIENLELFKIQYKKEFKILNSIKDNIILMPHHFKSCEDKFDTVFEQNDFIFIAENKEKIMIRIEKNLKKIF